MDNVTKPIHLDYWTQKNTVILPFTEEELREQFRRVIIRDLKRKPKPTNKQLRDGIVRYSRTPLMACELIEEFKLND